MLFRLFSQLSAEHLSYMCLQRESTVMRTDTTYCSLMCVETGANNLYALIHPKLTATTN